MMRRYVGLLICLLPIAFSGCSKTGQPGAAPAQQTVTSQTSIATPGATNQPAGPDLTPAAVDASKGRINACALLTSKEIQSIQGETLKETKTSGRSEGGFAISQCFYTLPTSTNSISLLVAQRGDPPAARDPREFWKETFHREELERERAQERESDRDKNRDNEKGKDKAMGREEEDERTAPPQRITGLGDDAFWMGNRVGGALYALSGNTYVRISVGSPGDHAANIKKCKALAQIILKRL